MTGDHPQSCIIGCPCCGRYPCCCAPVPHYIPYTLGRPITDERTLSDADIDAIAERVVQKLAARLAK